MGDKKPARFKAVANWYFGNFCAMRCLREPEDLGRLECHEKILALANERKEELITHKEFLRLVREELKICDRGNFKKREAIDCPICTATDIPQRKW
ncbi:MAG: hypothetical protein AABX01_03480 [Candidatus Micrarchaeota archaeon]